MKVNGVTLTILDQTGTYDYEWSEFAVMRGDDGYLYVGDTGGCSCNSFAENLDQITRVDSWQDAATAAMAWREGAYMADEKQGALDLIERLTRTSPAAFDASSVVVR